MFIDNKTVKKVMSTGVKTSEQDHAYMITKYALAKTLELLGGQYQKREERPKERNCSLGFYCSKFIKLQSALDTADRTETRAKAAVEYFGADFDIREIAKTAAKEYLFWLSQRDGKMVKN